MIQLVRPTEEQKEQAVGEVMDENEQIITLMNNTFIPERSAAVC